ncbi:methionine--tRNA ligase [Patescibacteria group bacterium]|nr:methionine--tRNA ligase [Patescibacteria group bacterium]
MEHIENIENIETVKFSDWQKINLRVGRIVKVENVEGADKLYKIIVNLGKELGERTLVAGLKPYYSLEQLKDKRCIVFTNLEKRKIRGVESQGMLLAATDENLFNNKEKETKVCLLQPDEDIQEGSLIR